MARVIADIDRPVSLGRRLLARLFDLCVYGSVGALVYAATDIELVRSPEFGLVLLGLYSTDHLVGGSRFGCSVSQWLLGYVVTRIDGAPASLVQHLGRLLSFLALSWLALFTSPFRRDRATVHDLLTRTRAYRTAGRPRRTRLRLAIAAGCIALSSLYGLSRLLHVFYEIKILPVEIAIEENLADELASQATPAADPFVFRDVVLLDVAGLDSSPRVCRSPHDPLHYTLAVDGEELELTYFHEPRPAFSYMSMPRPDEQSFEVADLPYFGPFALFATDLPMSPPSHVSASSGPDGSLPDFPLLSPVDNLAEISQRILWIIAVPNTNRLREKFDWQMES